jgi:hypothetical protein
VQELVRIRLRDLRPSCEAANSGAPSLSSRSLDGAPSPSSTATLDFLLPSPRLDRSCGPGVGIMLWTLNDGGDNLAVVRQEGKEPSAQGAATPSANCYYCTRGKRFSTYLVRIRYRHGNRPRGEERLLYVWKPLSTSKLSGLATSIALSA